LRHKTLLGDFEQFSLLEAYVCRQQVGETEQRGGIGIGIQHAAEEGTQLGMLAQRARNQGLFAGLGHGRQEAGFFNHEMRLELRGKNLGASRDCRGDFPGIARSGRTAGAERQLDPSLTTLCHISAFSGLRRL
jgi:hypothetical protein